MLKYRNRQILKVLINQEKITGSELALIFNVSTRTIRNDIQNINIFLKEFDCTINSNNINGYFLVGSENDCKKILTYLDNDNASLKYEPEYRIKYLLLKLLSQKFTDLDLLSNELFVSVSTLLGDIKLIEHSIDEHNLNFEIQRQKNQIHIAFLNENEFCRDWAKLISEESNDIDNEILNTLSVRQITFEDINVLISNIMSKNSLWLSNQEMNFFTSLIFAHIVRGFQSYYSQNQSFNGNRIIDALNSKLIKSFGIALSMSALSDINLVFTSLSKYKLDDANEIIVRPIVKDVFEKADSMFGTKLIQDTQVIDGVVSHLISFFNKEALHINFTDNIKTEIRDLYPLAYNISKFLVIEISKYKELHHVQLNYEQSILLSIHIQASIERVAQKRKFNALIISSYGFGSTKLLETQLKNEFEYLDILASVASYAFEMIDFTDIDIVITTTPVNINKDIPVVEVQIPLNTNSIENIKNVLNSNYYWARNIYPVILELPENLENEKDAFLFIEDTLKPIEGDVHLYDKLVERENLFTTNIGKGIAMPHIIYEERLNYNLYFLYSKKGIHWKNSTIHLVALILITADAKDFINDYMKLINQIYQTDSVKNFKANMLFKQLEIITSGVKK